jgi:hypothetical protein
MSNLPTPLSIEEARLIGELAAENLARLAVQLREAEDVQGVRRVGCAAAERMWHDCVPWTLDEFVGRVRTLAT